MTFDIPNEVFDIYYEGVDYMIDSAFGVDCTLIYPAVKSICPNCIYNSQTGKSSNKYKSGGPIQFTGMLCPYCSGDGYTESVETDSIKLRCYFDKKSWIKMPTEIKVVDGAVQTYGHMVDLPKCLRANEITLNDAQAGNGTFKYRLSGHPVPHGFKKNKYFIAVWERVK